MIIVSLLSYRIGCYNIIIVRVHLNTYYNIILSYYTIKSALQLNTRKCIKETYDYNIIISDIPITFVGVYARTTLTISIENFKVLIKKSCPCTI